MNKEVTGSDPTEEVSDRRRVLTAAAFLAATGGTLIANAATESRAGNADVNTVNFPKELDRPTYQEALAYLEFGNQDAKQQGFLATISEPIDVGADNLLTEWLRAKLVLPAQQVEYLLRTLSEHIQNCLELRRQAQDLESTASSALISMTLESYLVAVGEAHAEFNRTQMSRALVNKVDAIFDSSSGEIKNASSSNDYFESIHKIEMGYLIARKNSLLSKQKYFEESGGGANAVARFSFLKRLFNQELAEAYQRARTVSAGLYSIYGITLQVPDLKKVGYLDELAVWTRTAVYSLERSLVDRQEAVFIIPLRSTDNIPGVYLKDGQSATEKTAGKSFIEARNSGNFEFVIGAEHFDDEVIEPRIRGIDIALNGSNRTTDVCSAKLTLPKQIATNINGDEEQTWTPIANIAPVALISGDVSNVKGVSAAHNANPFGKWRLQISKANSSNTAMNTDATLQNVFLILKLSYRQK